MDAGIQITRREYEWSKWSVMKSAKIFETNWPWWAGVAWLSA